MKKGTLIFATILLLSMTLPAFAAENILNAVQIPQEAEYARITAVETPSQMPEARYVGVAQQNIAIRTEMSREAPSLGNYRVGEYVYFVEYSPQWLLVVKGNADNWVSGYVLRHAVSDISSIVGGILPYGTTPAVYTALLGSNTMLYAEPSETSEALHMFTPATKVAIQEIKDGWAKVIFWRQYAYFYLDSVEELTPVYDISSAQSGDTIAAFISFFSQSQDGLNPNRIINIAKACEYISIPMEPGFQFSFNGIAGPYQPGRGYLYGMSFFEGEAVPSYGGGTCQVSSTLYNVLLALDGGMTIVYRRPHGPSGAKYLPHGVDAAVGSKTLDLVFRNDYGFTVRLEASEHDGVLYIAMLKA